MATMSQNSDKQFLISPTDVNVIPLHEFLSFIQDSIPEKSREDLTALAAGMITDQSTHEKRHRFLFKVVRDLHPTLQNESEESGRLVVQLGKALLRNSYVSEFHDELNRMFEFAKMEPEKFMMVMLIGECVARKDKDYLCVAALLGVWNDKGLYITHMSVSDQIFSKAYFGSRGDGKSFLHRGIARLTVAVAQAFLRCIHDIEDIYLFSSYLQTNRGCLWEKLGFQRVENKRIFPESVIDLIDSISNTKFQELIVDQKKIPYFIRKPVNEYALFGHIIDTIYDGGQCLFFQTPFYRWPTLADDESLNSSSDIQLAAYCMQETPGAKKAEETIVPQRKLAKILLDILRHTQSKILALKQYYEQDASKELKSLLKDGCNIPDIAIDYANMALMISHGNPHVNIYTISTDTVKRLCEDGYGLAYSHFKSDFPDMMSEFDLMKEQSESRKARFIIPFYQQESKLWYTIVRIWLENCIIFLFTDCSDETVDDYELVDSEDGEIPLGVKLPFMDSPLWPIGVKSYWIRVPNVQQVEEESGARCFLHGYMMAKLPGYAAFHLSLLKLQDLDDEYDLNWICRNWVHDIMLRKVFFVPAAIQKIIELKEDPFPYGVQWFEDNCIPQVVKDLTEFQELEDELRSLNEHDKNMEKINNNIRDRVAILEARARGEVAGSRPLPAHPTDRFRLRKVSEIGHSSIDSSVRDVPKSLPVRPLGDNETNTSVDGNASTPVASVIADPQNDEGNNSFVPAETVVPAVGNSTTAVSVDVTTFETLGEVTLSQVDSSETTEMLLDGSASTDDDRIVVLPSRVSKYYDVFVPKTAEGYMIQVGDLTSSKLTFSDIQDRDLGYSTVFIGYRLHKNGDKSFVEQNQLFRNVGDIITAVNDVDVNRKSFNDVNALLKEAMPDINNMVKFTIMDRCHLTQTPSARDRIENLSQSLPSNLGGKHLFMAESNEDDSNEVTFIAPTDAALPSSPPPGNNVVQSVSRSETSNGPSDLIDTDDEVEQSPYIGISHSLQRLQLDPDKAPICHDCQISLNGKRILVALNDDGKIAVYCNKCGFNKRPFDKEMLDNKLAKTLGKLPENTYGVSNTIKFTFNEKHWKARLESENRLLTTMDEIMCFYRGGNLLYKGRPMDEEDKEFYIFDELVTETLFEFFPNELRKIRLEKTVWHELTPEVKHYIRLHGMCYSNDQLYYCLFETESEEWRYIRYNTRGQLNVIADVEYSIIDGEQDLNQDNIAWLSFTNNTRRAEIRMIPRYYLKRWELSCEKAKMPGTQNEYINVLAEAIDNANRWIEIPQGSSKKNYFSLDFGTVHHHLPKSFRIQPPGENSCIFNSLVNALHYINDYEARDLVLVELNKSLEYVEYRDVAKTRRAFAAYVMNYCVKGYTAKLLTNLNVLTDRTMWPTLCILKGDDNSTNHAVTIVENYIFDSNNSYALPLNESTLDWCCSGDTGAAVKFVCVPLAYRFHRHNPPPPLVLRHGKKNILAVQAVIRSLLEIKDTLSASSLEEYQNVVTPDINVIAGVREILKSKELQYVPLMLKDVNQLLLQTSHHYPTMFLLHIRGTFHFAIFSSIGNQYFDGTRGESMTLTPENLFNSLDHNNEAEVATYAISDLEIIKGYIFTKKEKTSSTWKKRRVLLSSK
jgi:hypothetical protein